MKITKIEDSGDRGWFVGCFPKAAFQTDLAEVCYKVEPIGKVKAHYHTKCTETMMIVSGLAICRGQKLSDGDIIVLDPGEVNDIEYLEETQVISVKTPAGGDDKVLI